MLVYYFTKLSEELPIYPRPLRMVLVTEALNSTTRFAAVELEVGSIFNYRRKVNLDFLYCRFSPTDDHMASSSALNWISIYCQQFLQRTYPVRSITPSRLIPQAEPPLNVTHVAIAYVPDGIFTTNTISDSKHRLD